MNNDLRATYRVSAQEEQNREARKSIRGNLYVLKLTNWDPTKSDDVGELFSALRTDRRHAVIMTRSPSGVRNFDLQGTVVRR